MFDQPEFEALLRANLKRHPHAELAGQRRGHRSRSDRRRHESQVTFIDRVERRRAPCRDEYVLGCDGANSLVRARSAPAWRHEIRAALAGGRCRPPTADLDQWDGVHQVCDPHRAATYMRIGDTRYRWEFRLLPGETADDYETCRR